MKQNISYNNLIEFLGDNIEINLQKLEDIMRSVDKYFSGNYISVYNFLDHDGLDDFSFYLSVCKDFNIGKMIEILQSKISGYFEPTYNPISNGWDIVFNNYNKDRLINIYCLETREKDLCNALWKALQEFL